MSTLTVPSTCDTLDQLVDRLGNIPLHRIRLHPPPGTATEADILAHAQGEQRPCELVDGVLVDKAMGYYESVLAIVLGYFLHDFLKEHNLGVVSGEAGTLRLMPGLVRAPDLCFIAWERFPNRAIPTEPVPSVGPDLAVEILSQGNTEEEMERKRREYFAAGARLTWLVDPKTRSVCVYTSPTEFRLLGEEETLEGEPVLPGFRLSIREWFERASRGPDR